jgi:hypothetical protein
VLVAGWIDVVVLPFLVVVTTVWPFLVVVVTFVPLE